MFLLEIIKGLNSGEKLFFQPGIVIVGRDEEYCQLVLNDNKVSRFHCKITLLEDGSVIVEDQKSTNGTII